ncbi:hypothetical protein AADG42_12905 [Ammonicoccus fulvus]|uniref:Uncharacterized protein n=1 Tax=Ammonicoccus fulvus TaxID=3138240 RepID=A0ABZ3FTR3_9ACTN
MTLLTGYSFPNFGMAQMTTVPAWINTMMQVSTKAWNIAMTSQQVIAMRLSMIAVGGNTAKNRNEVERMVNEKMDAVGESTRVLMSLGNTMVQAWPTMFTDPKAAERMLNQAAKASDRALTPFSKRVNANQKRLSR